MVTIPTIDQISGTTVMNKMRSLIRNYIDFAEEIVNEMYTKEEIDIIVESIDTRISMKQDTLISGTNIKTVDGKSLLGSGNVEIDFSNFYTKAQIDTLITSKQDLLVSGTNIKTINGNSILGSGNLQVTVDLSDYYTKSVIDGFLSEKQDILISGTNIKTVNGNSLIGSGDITVGGGSTLKYSEFSTNATNINNFLSTFTDGIIMMNLQLKLNSGSNVNNIIYVVLVKENDSILSAPKMGIINTIINNEPQVCNIRTITFSSSGINVSYDLLNTATTQSVTITSVYNANIIVKT